jgi:hypothetical protein
MYSADLVETNFRGQPLKFVALVILNCMSPGRRIVQKHQRVEVHRYTSVYSGQDVGFFGQGVLLLAFYSGLKAELFGLNLTHRWRKVLEYKKHVATKP